MTTPPPPARPGWHLPLVLLSALAIVRAGWVEERDPYWQARAGSENLAGAALVRADSWSWDPVSAPFVQTSPGWNMALGAGWDALGFGGLFLLGLASISTYLWSAWLLSRRLGARPLPTLLGFAAPLALGMAFISPRASLVAQSIFLLALAIADRWRISTRRVTAWSTAGVFLAVATTTAFGSWIHLSWILLAPALATSCSVLWATMGRWPILERLALIASTWIGVAVGALAGPYGTDALAVSRRVQEACQGVITEWITPFTPALALRWLPAAGLTLALTAWALRRIWRGRRTLMSNPRTSLSLALLVLAAPAAAGGVLAIRFIGVALLTLAPVGAVWATRWSDVLSHRRRAEPPTGVLRNARIRFWSDGRRWPPVLWGVLAVLSPLVLLAGAEVSRPQPEHRLMAALPTGCRLLSTPSAAGPVILERPDVTVWWDGRVDYYGRDRNIRNIRLLSGTSVDDASVEEATCIMLDRSGEVDVSGFAKALDSSGSWTQVSSVGDGTVWLRTEGGSP